MSSPAVVSPASESRTSGPIPKSVPRPVAARVLVRRCERELRVLARTVASEVAAPIAAFALRMACDGYDGMPAADAAGLARIVAQHYRDLALAFDPYPDSPSRRMVRSLGVSLGRLEYALAELAIAERTAASKGGA